MRRRCSLIGPLLLLALVPACGESDGSDPPASDAATGSSDGSAVSCEQRDPLEIGHCIDDATGEPCLDFESPERRFVPVDEDTVVPTIVGLQGSSMLVMAVRARGIAPGQDDMAPLVDLQVTIDGNYLGGYTARPIVNEGDDDEVTAPQLYVVIFAPTDLEGERVDVTSEVTDRNGDSWCGDSSFEVGPLIESEPLH